MKVAVCISGQMRSYKQCVDSLNENLIQPLNADVFIHTWSSTGLSTKLMVYIPPPLYHVIPHHLEHDVTDMIYGDIISDFEKTFPSLYKAIVDLSGARESVNADLLKRLYGSSHCVVEDFEPKRLMEGFNVQAITEGLTDLGLNAIPMYYKIFACDQMRQHYENMSGAKYDSVIRIRPDFEVLGRIPESRLRDPGPGGLATLHNQFYDDGNIKGAAFDAFAIGTSEAMTVYSSLWNDLKDYYDPAQYKQMPMGGRGPETFLYWHLSKIGAQDSIYKPDFPIRRKSIGLSARDVVDLIRQDVGGNAEYSEVLDKLMKFEEEHLT